MGSATAFPMTDRRDDQVRCQGRGATERFRRRLRWTAWAFVIGWTVVVVAITAVATGRWGDLGLPTDELGRPRGVIVIGASTILAAIGTIVARRRIDGPLSELLRAAERVGDGEYESLEVDVRGPRELRVLGATFNEMAVRLAETELQRRRFLADITHELRNPLFVLTSAVEAQLDGVHPRDDEHLASVLDEARRIELLIEDLHSLALAESGRLIIHRKRLALDELAREAVLRHDARARRMGVSVRSEIEAVSVQAWGDAARLRQVLDNLLSNAIRHSPIGTEVVVAVQADDLSRTVRCRVTDSGAGFEAAQLERLFERFSRPADSHGSGLGLSISAELIAAHGGTITASNDTERGGATIEFSLPMWERGSETTVSRPEVLGRFS